MVVVSSFSTDLQQCCCPAAAFPVRRTLRYTAGYPNSPLLLELRDQQGLSSDDVQQLAEQLEETAAASAELGQVCVFDLVGVCQVRRRQQLPVACTQLHASFIIATEAHEL